MRPGANAVDEDLYAAEESMEVLAIESEVKI